MSTKAHVTVTIKASKRKGLQRYSYVIDKPGNAAKETKREFYTRPFTAWIGGVRQVGGTKTSHGYECVIKGKAYPIIRVNKN